VKSAPGSYAVFMTEARRPKHHYIPAVVLGGFSADIDRERRRDRRLNVVTRTKPTPHLVTARSLGHVRGLYDFRGNGPLTGLPIDTLENTFQAYERHLSSAFQAAGASLGSLPFEPWMRTLLPYVAGISVRSPHFLGATADDPNVMIQESRWMEMSRRIAPLMAADWYLDEAPPGSRFIINDRGYTWLRLLPGDRLGILVPVTPRHALAIMPNAERVIARRPTGGTWYTPLPRLPLTAADVARLNGNLAHAAVEWFAGVDEADVADLQFGETDVEASAMGSWWVDRGRLGQHDQDWLAAMDYAGFTINASDWQPISIMSSIEPGVRLMQTPSGDALEVSFLKPQANLDNTDLLHAILPASDEAARSLGP
jgi:hypothetical protein